MYNHAGEFFALGTAVFWTVTALAFESASKKIGSLAVNVIRLLIGFFFLSIFIFLSRGTFLPAGASREIWIWLLISGLVGFVFGDLFLFKSYTIIGSRFSMLIQTLVPPITALFGWLILGEKLTLLNYLGMVLTFSGISMAVFSRENKNEKISFKLSPRGVAYALYGALGQALGLVLSKFGMKDYDPFSANQIRIIAGISGFAVLITFMKRWSSIYNTLFNVRAMVTVTLGSFFGPFLGVSFSLLAIRHTQTGIASTIMAIIPVLIIPPAVIIFKQKVTIPELIGAIVSVCGVTIFFI